MLMQMDKEFSVYREAEHTFWYLSYFIKDGKTQTATWTVIQDVHPLIWLAKYNTNGNVCLISWQIISHEVWKEYCTIKRL